MTDTPEPLDLSLLARVSSDSTFREDKPPQIPGGESDRYREEPTRPRSAGPSRPRSPRRTRASVEDERATKPAPQSVVRDDTPTYHAGMLVKPLTDLYVVVGTAVYPFDQSIGAAFIENAKSCAEALDQAARVDKKLRAVLMSLVGASVWGPVIVAHAPIATAIALKLVPNLRPAPMPSVNGQPA